MLEPLLRLCRVSLKTYLSDTWADIWSSSLAICCIFTVTSNILLAFLITTTAHCLPGTMLTHCEELLLCMRTVRLFPFNHWPNEMFSRHQERKKHPFNVIYSETHLSKSPFLMRAPAVTPWRPQSPPWNPVHHHRHWFWETSVRSASFGNAGEQMQLWCHHPGDTSLWSFPDH